MRFEGRFPIIEMALTVYKTCVAQICWGIQGDSTLVVEMTVIYGQQIVERILEICALL